MRHMTRFLSVLAAAVLAVLPLATLAQDGPLRIEITEGVIEPLPFAVPNFVAENTAAADMSQQLTRVVAQDLMGTGLFREIPPDAHIARITSFSSPVQYADWKAINAQALITGAVSVGAGGALTVKFRLYDVFSGQEMGSGLQFNGTTSGWRRMAHKVADNSPPSAITGIVVIWTPKGTAPFRARKMNSMRPASMNCCGTAK